MSEAVVPRALLAIGEHRVGLRGLFEQFFGRFVACVPIGVVLERHLPVGALDRRFVGVARYAENLVVVTRRCHACATLTIAARSKRSRMV